MWVDLREGKLSWYRLSPGGTPLGAIQMVGSAVALVSPNEVRFSCFSFGWPLMESLIEPRVVQV